MSIQYKLYVLQGDVEEDDTIPDKESDIRPRFHKSKTHSQKHLNNEEVSSSERVGHAPPLSSMLTHRIGSLYDQVSTLTTS